MNKKGDSGNQLMLIAFLFLILIISVGIFSGIALFFGSGYDGRDIDARVINFLVKECVLDRGIEGIEENFYSKCGIEEKVIEKGYGIKICVDKEDCVNEDFIFMTGSDFVSCGLEGTKNNLNYARCFSQKFEKEGKRIEIITKANQDIEK